jgi:hypothetical protein
MYGVVVKPFTAYGVPYNPGDMVELSDFPKADSLKRARMIRDATVDEVMEATGKQLPAAPVVAPSRAKTSAAQTPSKGNTPKSMKAAPPPTLEPPLRQSRQARAKAARQ